MYIQVNLLVYVCACFNRCKRLHPLLATAFQILHSQKFLDQHGPIPDTLINEISLLKENPSAQAIESLESSETYLKFMRQYTEYTDITLSGGHGNTARFWMLYVSLVHPHMMFSRAFKTNALCPW